MHISLWVTSSYHLLCRNFQPSKATPSACLESPPRGGENYPKGIHCPAPCFQAGNLFSHAPHLEIILPPHISERNSQATHHLFSHAAQDTILLHLQSSEKTYIGISSLSFYTRWGEQLSCADSLLHKLHFRTSWGNSSASLGSKTIKSLREIYSRKFQDSVHSVEEEAEGRMEITFRPDFTQFPHHSEGLDLHTTHITSPIPAARAWGWTWI